MSATNTAETSGAFFDQFYTVPDMGKLLGLDAGSAYRLAARLEAGEGDYGDMPAPRRVVGRILFLKSELDAFIEENLTPRTREMAL